MDPLSIISSAVKTVFGALFGFFLGAIVQLTDTGALGIIVGAILLGYLLFAISVIEIFGALILGFLTLGVGSYFELVGKLADKFPVADALGQAPWMDTFFSLLIIFMAALVVVKLLWGRATEGAGVPEDVNWGCGALIGLILIGLLFWSTSSGNADNPLNTWVLGGGIIGFLLSFIPGPPLS